MPTARHSQLFYKRFEVNYRSMTLNFYKISISRTSRHANAGSREGWESSLNFFIWLQQQLQQSGEGRPVHEARRRATKPSSLSIFYIAKQSGKRVSRKRAHFAIAALLKGLECRSQAAAKNSRLLQQTQHQILSESKSWQEKHCDNTIIYQHSIPLWYTHWGGASF